jgi:hypothetical protein
MLTLMFLLVLTQVQEDGKPADEVKDVTAADYCRTAYDERLFKVLEVQSELSLLQKKSDWDKLSTEAKAKIEKPFRDRIAKIRANRAFDPNVKFPTDAEQFEVFSLPVPPERGAKVLSIQQVIDKTTVVAGLLRPAVGNPERPETIIPGAYTSMQLVVSGLKPSEVVDKAGTTIRISGLWQRIEDLKLDGKEYVQVMRWPHEQVARKMWPKYIEERDKQFDNPEKPADQNKSPDTK